MAIPWQNQPAWLQQFQLYRPTYSFGYDDDGQLSWTGPDGQPHRYNPQFDPQPVYNSPQFRQDLDWFQRDIQYNQPGGPFYDPSSDSTNIFSSMPGIVIAGTGLGMAGAPAVSGALAAVGAGGGVLGSGLTATQIAQLASLGYNVGSLAANPEQGTAGTISTLLAGVPGAAAGTIVPWLGSLVKAITGQGLGYAARSDGGSMATDPTTGTDTSGGGLNWGALLPALIGLVGQGIGVAGGVAQAGQSQQVYGEKQALYQLLMQMAAQYYQQLNQYNQQTGGAYQQQLDNFQQQMQRSTQYQAQQNQQYQEQQAGYITSQQDYGHAKDLIDTFNQQRQGQYGQQQLDYNTQRQLIDNYNRLRSEGYTQQQADYALMRGLDVQYQQQQQGVFGQQVADYQQMRQLATQYQGQQQDWYKNARDVTYPEIQKEIAQDRSNIQNTLASRNAIAGRLADPNQVAAGSQAMLNPFLRGVEQEVTQGMARNLAGQGVSDGGAYNRAVAGALVSNLAPYYQQATQNYLGSQQAALGGYTYAPQGPTTPYAPAPPVPGGLPGVPQAPVPGGLPQYPQAPMPAGYPGVPGPPQPEFYPQVPGAPAPPIPGQLPDVPMPPRPAYAGDPLTQASGVLGGQGGMGSLGQLLQQLTGGGAGQYGSTGTAIVNLLKALGVLPSTAGGDVLPPLNINPSTYTTGNPVDPLNPPDTFVPDTGGGIPDYLNPYG